MEEKMALVDKFLYLDGECNFKKAELFHKNYKDAVKFYKRSYDNFKEAYSLWLELFNKRCILWRFVRKRHLRTAHYSSPARRLQRSTSASKSLGLPSLWSRTPSA